MVSIHIMNEPIIVEQSYNASKEEVWNAITDKECMKQWYFDIPDFELKENTEFNFYEPGEAKQYHHRCVIQKIVPFEKLQHTWTHPSHSKGESVLTWELNEEEGTTTVRLTHAGIENFADGGEAFKKENYKVGWNEILTQLLKDFLENEQ